MFYPKTMLIYETNGKEDDKEFEIYIKPVIGKRIFSINVTKLMALRQLKKKLEKEKCYDKNHYNLSFKKSLNDESKTL
jgi:hypothetical protein